jgi:hypothetical protein
MIVEPWPLLLSFRLLLGSGAVITRLPLNSRRRLLLLLLLLLLLFNIEVEDPLDELELRVEPPATKAALPWA